MISYSGRTERWQDRHRRLAAALPGPETVLADVITHPEMLAVARLLIAGHRPPGIQPVEIAARLGFPYLSRPHPLDPSSTTCHGDRRLSGPERRRQAPAQVTITGMPAVPALEP